MAQQSPLRRTARTESEVRTDLAAAFRLAALNGWDDTIYTHLSATVPGQPGQYLINEFGLGFDEVCASNLIQVDVAGQVVDGSGRPVNPSGFAIHGAVHAARPEIECVIHLHAPWGVALSMLPQGLLPTSQWAMRLFGRLGRHAYEGLALGEGEQKRLAAKTHAQWTGDGQEWDGDAEWPALLRRTQRLSPGFDR